MVGQSFSERRILFLVVFPEQHFISEVRSGRIRREQFQFNAAFRAEVFANIADHVLFRRRREARYRDGLFQFLVFLQFFDEGTNVAVIHSEILPPGREAVCLVDYESDDVAGFQ